MVRQGTTFGVAASVPPYGLYSLLVRILGIICRARNCVLHYYFCRALNVCNGIAERLSLSSNMRKFIGKIFNYAFQFER